ncbi:hypothetical protein KQ878_03465 [Mycoplasma zalophidermidis]|uniref:Type I restriction modification DNA specificity domain-containing protein n=1 Tax=Mycoplasma zalophidermidis TaxID=398174 RepID=A0ABS6DSF2_9MOLU|nr:hypothetical protein [Mycoplasma zalophidermidis]MBU4693926.1 hypothetical protein [Mycoplasma zalophidermidis]
MGEVLKYLRPDKFIITDENIILTGKIPVLTANKSNLLGYSNKSNFFSKECILFDDFTMSNKYINFPFLVKSSAIKILISNSKENSLFMIYKIFSKLKSDITEHKRHYIQETQFIKILLPCANEDKMLKRFCLLFDRAISLLQW